MSARTSLSSSAGPRTVTAREKPGGEVIIFSGRAFAWDSESQDMGGFVEVFRKGAANNVIASGAKIYAIQDHEMLTRNFLGSTADGTLHLYESDSGLDFVIHSPPTQAARDAAPIARANRLGVSLAFRCKRDRKTRRPDALIFREILELASIEELSLVVDPAYPSSQVMAVIANGTAANRSRPVDPEFARCGLELWQLERRCQLDAQRLADASFLDLRSPGIRPTYVAMPHYNARGIPTARAQDRGGAAAGA